MASRWFRFLPLLLILCFQVSFSTSAQGASSTKKAPKAAEGSKKTGFSGDPARKRGMELGFDLGKKCGKNDLEQALKPDLKRHEDYEKPEKYFRSEYGSQASFVGGFRSGFSGGYQAAFGKKVPMSSSGYSGEKSKTTTTATTTSSKPPAKESSSDAL